MAFLVQGKDFRTGMKKIMTLKDGEKLIYFGHRLLEQKRNDPIASRMR
jgi:hypothetical protein